MLASHPQFPQHCFCHTSHITDQQLVDVHWHLFQSRNRFFFPTYCKILSVELIDIHFMEHYIIWHKNKNIHTFNALIIVSWCFFTASWENSEVANRHILSKARYLLWMITFLKNHNIEETKYVYRVNFQNYLKFVSLCCRNCPSWLQARTRRFGSLKWNISSIYYVNEN